MNMVELRPVACSSISELLRNDVLCVRIARHVYEEIDLVYKSQSILRTASFKYLGSCCFESRAAFVVNCSQRLSPALNG